MRTRSPAFFLAVFFIFGFAAVAVAQEGVGAGRMELSATPGGGILFTKPAKTNEIDFSNYALGGAFTYNINSRLGVEGELGAGLGIHHQFTTTVSAPVLDESGNPILDENGNVMMGTQAGSMKSLSPRTLAYQGNVIYNPRGKDRALVPYVAAGLGGLTMFTRPTLKDLGLTNDETFLTGNVGAGVKWFLTGEWGVRADYRFLAVKSRSDAPAFFGLDQARYGHRVYGSVVYTFGR